MELTHVFRIAIVLALCLGLSLEQMTHNDGRPARKSRRKRRQCKCIQRYRAEVHKLIDERLAEFTKSYGLKSKNEKRDVSETSNNYLRNGLLRLSTDVAETKNSLRTLTDDLHSFMSDLAGSKKDYSRLTRRVTHMARSLANLTKHVDTMETRLTSRAQQAAPSDDEDDPDVPPKELSTHCQAAYDRGKWKHEGDYYVMIKPEGVTHAFRTLCHLANNTAWTVIQKRQDGSVDFYRSWDEYKRGFGTLEGEFWLGLDNIHYLTSQEDMMVRIDMEDWNGGKFFALYDAFKVAGAEMNYRLKVGGYHGESTAGNSLNSVWDNHNGMLFSTKDRDNDARFYDSCAQHYKGAWWFNNCFEAHLNGKYYHKGFHQNYFQRDGIQWNTIHMYSSLKYARMMVKPAPLVDNGTPTGSANNNNNANNNSNRTSNEVPVNP